MINFQLLPNLRKRTRDAKELAQFFQAGESVLDLGAGAGILAAELQSITGARFTLLDVVDYNRTNLPLQLYNGKRIPFTDGIFDTTILVWVLHHLKTFQDQEGLLREVQRVTKNKVIILEVTPPDWIQWWLNTAWDVIANTPHGVQSTFRYRSIGGWRDMFHRLGFSITQEVRRRSLLSTTIFVLRR